MGEKKCKKITWKDLSSSQGIFVYNMSPCSLAVLWYLLVDTSVFQVQEIKKPDNSPSPLTLLLQQEEVLRTNPYYTYSRYNGEVNIYM